MKSVFDQMCLNGVDSTEAPELSEPDKELLGAALGYAERGWRVHPLNGKAPLLKGWPKKATTDPDTINRWWRKWPEANIGILTGSTSLLLVIDVDNKRGVSGAEGIERLQIEHGELPETLVASTPHGEHHYFTSPNVDVRNSVGTIAPGVDIRSNGGYVVAPPSQVSGVQYAWQNDIDPIPLPSEWINLLRMAEPTLSAEFLEGTRDNTIFREACKLRARNVPEEEARAILQTLNAEHGSPPLSKRQVNKCLQSAWRYPAGYLPNDLGNAQRFVELFGDRIHYVVELKQFIVWRKHRWEVDTDDLLCIRLMKRSNRRIWLEARDCTDPDVKKALTKYALRASDTRILKASIESIKSEEGIAIHVHQLDADPYLIGVENGVVDLRTGKWRRTEKGDLVTRSTGCGYEKYADCPVWRQFLERIFPNRPDVIDYLQRIVGYALTGSTVEQILVFLLGVGANGKTVFTEALKTVFGDYGRTLRTEALMSGLRGRGGPSEDEARLVGARMVTANETSEGMRFDEATIKDLTGGDTISARYLYKNTFEFIPQFTLFIRGNFKPTFNGADGGMARRLKLITFDEIIPAYERDTHLLEKLRGEAPGILNWAIKGCLNWQANGLFEPATVQAATSDYLGEMDSFGSFFAEFGSINRKGSIRSGTLRRKYKVYCEDRGLIPMSSQKVARYLRSRGVTPYRRRVDGKQQRGWRGMALRALPRVLR